MFRHIEKVFAAAPQWVLLSQHTAIESPHNGAVGFSLIITSEQQPTNNAARIIILMTASEAPGRRRSARHNLYIFIHRQVWCSLGDCSIEILKRKKERRHCHGEQYGVQEKIIICMCCWCRRMIQWRTIGIYIKYTRSCVCMYI
jgi:hypothetical protein